MRLHLVANPTAGQGRARRAVEAFVAACAARGAEATVHWTIGPGDAGVHAATLRAGDIDRLVVAGGDGTIHEVVNGYPGALPWPMSVLPLGTANLLARETGVPLRAPPARWAALALDGRPRPIDLLETNHGKALAVAGVGLDAEVVRAVASARRGARGGYWRWVVPLARTIARYEAPRLLVRVDDGRPVEGGAVVVQNAYNYGGLFALSGRARCDDGLLDVVVLRRATQRDHFRMLARALAGRLDLDRGVVLAQGVRVEVLSEAPRAVQTDGDPAGTTPLTARVRPAGLIVMQA